MTARGAWLLGVHPVVPLALGSWSLWAHLEGIGAPLWGCASQRDGHLCLSGNHVECRVDVDSAAWLLGCMLARPPTEGRHLGCF